MSGGSLTGLISRCHRELREIFQVHQEALLVGEFSQAVTLFRCYHTCHELHKQFEDDVLFPMFATLSEQGRWPASVYEKEHVKITQWFDRLEQDLQSLTHMQLNKKQGRLNIIAMLDREKSFKGLVEHHEEREEEALLPALDEHTDRKWRDEVLAVFSQKWQVLLAEQMVLVRNICGDWEK